MLKLGSVALGKGPVIALTVTDRETSREIVQAKRHGARLLEIRIDGFRSLDAVSVAKKVRGYRRFKLPLIATVRSAKEGGRRELPDSKRFELFKKILPDVHAVDLELASVRLRKVLVPKARRLGKRVILSYHNFKSVPSDRKLLSLVQKAKRGGADIVKLAVTPKRSPEVVRFLLFAKRERDQRLIAIAMGEKGKVSRILAPWFGSLLTYSFVGRPLAPGQIPIERYRFRRGHVSTAFPKFISGFPLTPSFSPRRGRGEGEGVKTGDEV